jgi:AraC family transcriptional regulator
MFLARNGARAASRTMRAHLVEHVVEEMRGRFVESLTLEELAGMALLSPYHFHRVFREVTGVPPGRFLAALRMEEAKRLVLTTPLRITDICLDVGYASFGTFTTQFKQLVGLSPRRLRRLADRHAGDELEELCDAPLGADPAGAPVGGRVVGPPGYSGTAFVGLFPTQLAQSRPATCASLAAPGHFVLGGMPPGSYSALACAFCSHETVLSSLLPDAESILVAVAQEPVVVGPGSPDTRVELVLRKPATTDPPVVLALPLLLLDRQAERPRVAVAN